MVLALICQSYFDSKLRPGIIINATAKEAISKATANLSVCSTDYNRNALSSQFLTQTP